MKLKLLLLLSGVLIMSGANANEPRLYIRSVFDIQYAFCDIKTNDVTGFSNRNSAQAGHPSSLIRKYFILIFINID